MYIRSDFWRVSLLSALGIYPFACGGETTSEQANDVGETLHPSATPSGAEYVRTEFEPGRSGCGESTPHLVDGQQSDLEVCAKNGLVHRVKRVEEVCSSVLPRPDRIGADTTTPSSCAFDADCTAASNGYCVLGCPTGQFCLYGCLTDADCELGEECGCGSLIGTCHRSNCRDDSDCGEGFLCAASGAAFRCQRPEDECAVDSDCPPGDWNGSPVRGVCAEGEARLTCALDLPYVCGRPFLVGGEARLAKASATHFGHSRTTTGCVEFEEPDAMMRAAIGGYWTEVGLMEHASIAAFARFVLQLMHVGAPLPLLEAAQQALRDETEHAKACFEIVTRVLGQPVGPGALSMNHAFDETTLESIVRLTIREGCIGETFAAMEAAEAAATCVDPHIRSVLQRIQTDELRHAELAWRFVQWSLAHSKPGVDRDNLEALIRREFANPLAHQPDVLRTSSVTSNPTLTATEYQLARYGVLPDATRLEVRRLALRDVIAPCVAQLVQTPVALALAALDHSQCATE